MNVRFPFIYIECTLWRMMYMNGLAYIIRPIGWTLILLIRCPGLV